MGNCGPSVAGRAHAAESHIDTAPRPDGALSTSLDPSCRRPIPSLLRSSRKGFSQVQRAAVVAFTPGGKAVGTQTLIEP
ncbi:hypothetical protein AQJ91_07260 [Streptomyces dysideae]|uniref:Uncharacterized protein n=1 Tax=Streptomyces dysideae TaxID=909626 RepID=A0A124IFM7_9ACTN|nr:hypothetical protein AQJ91_07260 [Streptomyces dysideae]